MTTINKENFRIMLERTSTNGMIEECVLEIGKDAQATITAITLSNDLVMTTQSELAGLPNGIYGLPLIGTLLKFLSMCKDEELSYSFTKDKKQLTLRQKGHGSFTTQLYEPSMVNTRYDAEKLRTAIKEKYSKKSILPLKQEFIDDALNYSALVTGGIVAFTVKDKKAIFGSAQRNTPHRFSVTIAKSGAGEDRRTAVYCDQIRNVLSTIKVNEKSKILLENGLPIILIQDENSFWAVTPVPEEN